MAASTGDDMTKAIRYRSWMAVLAALTLAVVATACGSGDGSGPSLTIPADVSVPDVSVPDVSIPERSTTTTADSTTTTADDTTTTSSDDSTTTTSDEPTTTTTEEPTTTTTAEESTTTTAEETTTTTAGDEVASPTTLDDGADDDGPSPWLWVALIALIAAIIGVIVAMTRSGKGSKQWAASARDVIRSTEVLAMSLEQAAGTLAGPTPGDRQVWLTSTDRLTALDTSVTALAGNVPDVPGDATGTNSAAIALDKLRADIAVARSATTDAERTRFDLVGPTDQQLEYAAETVRRASSSLTADAHALGTAVDRIDAPPQTTA